jgi:hypothetical protein
MKKIGSERDITVSINMYLFDISNEEECTAKDEKITYSI